jgi:nitrogen fixation/metabolism regulation signal transduction histidine kinase
MIAALFFFAAFGLFFNYVYENELNAVMRKGINKNLVSYLQNEADDYSDSASQKTAQNLLERQLQWEAIAPFIMKAQKDNIRNIMFALLGFILLLMFFSILYITSPLKKLAKHVEIIGKGEFAEIEVKSGGALGVLENKIFHLQKELMDLREKEKVAVILKTWRDIAKTMAHEIKNPLTPMRLNIDGIEEKARRNNEIDAQELMKFTERMNRQIEHLEELVNRFKSFSDVHSVNLVSANVADLIKTTADGVEEKITTLINGYAKCLLDKNLFTQILLNLYKNSINAGANKMEINIEKIENTVKISFTDNGRGIEKEKLNIVFLPYVKFSENGSGIGLSVVKNLTESMGGKVYAQIPQQKGLRIVIELKGGENNG